MSLEKCLECKKPMDAQANFCPHCGAGGDKSGQVVAKYSYSILNASPLLFFTFIALSVAGVGVILLLAWHFIMLPRPKLIVADSCLIYKDNYFKTRVIHFNDIEDIVAGASPFQRLIRSGWLKINLKGIFNFPVILNGFPEPEKIKALISKRMI